MKTLDLDVITGLSISRPTLEDAYLVLVDDKKNNDAVEVKPAEVKGGVL